MKGSFAKTLIQFGARFHSFSGQLFEQIRPEEVTPLQFEILKYLTFTSNVTMGMIAACLSLNITNASREVRKLVEAGYLRKSGDTRDRRIVYVELTAQGEKYMQQIVSLLEEVIRTRFMNLSARDQQSILTAIATLDRLMLQ